MHLYRSPDAVGGPMLNEALKPDHVKLSSDLNCNNMQHADEEYDGNGAEYEPVSKPSKLSDVLLPSYT
jgi:hypothetical protein